MPSVELTDEQVVQVVEQLAAERQAAVLALLVRRAVATLRPDRRITDAALMGVGSRSSQTGGNMKALETERLLLRPYTMEDAEDLHRVIFSDPEVCYYYCGKTKTLEEVRENVAYRLTQYRLSRFGCLAVIRKEDSALIGLVALHDCLMWYHVFEGQDPRYNNLEVELAYAFGRPYQKQGYATEACRALIDYAFRELKLRRIAYGVLKENVNSWNLMMRLGFRPERDLKPDGGENINVGVLDNTLV